jgi:hypothetical protein
MALARGAARRQEMAEHLVAGFGARSVLELGVWRGAFAAAMLRDCPGIETYWMLDPWRSLEGWNKPWNVSDAEFEGVHAAAVAETEFAADRRRLLRGTTAEVIGQIADGSLDFAYVDGDHTLRGITVDLLNVWPKLRDGGWLMGDDFSPTIWQHSAEFEPTMVFPWAVCFAEAMQCPIVALPHNQFLIRKDLSRPGFSFRDPDRLYGPTDVLSQLAPPSRGPVWAARVMRAVRKLRG